jgi:acyl-CoA reductase-like NAD-dependent aldehyde dehydrogenase
VIYKASEHCLATGACMEALLFEAGVPADAFQFVTGAGAAGAALLDQPIDGVFFTGSHATGVRIATAVAPKLIPVQLELGGKDPAYVTDSADPVKAAHALADGAFYNNGQSCCAVERILVQASVAEDFIEAFVQTVDTFVMGPPGKAETYLGPVTREAQLDVLEAQVKDAVDQGATLLCGGKRVEGAGWYFEPTVLTDVTHQMAVMREESFGPIIGIQVVADDAEAVQLMNDTRYGLTAAVYGADEARCRGVMAELNAGTVYWNCCDRVSPRLEWTGRGDSGMGSTLGMRGISAFVQPKAWHLRG